MLKKSCLDEPIGIVIAHITTFEACSSFTRVTACRVAHPPYVGFIARLRPGRFPGSGARKLPSSTNNLLGWVLPPLVICAVEAHTITPSFGPIRYCMDSNHGCCLRKPSGRLMRRDALRRFTFFPSRSARRAALVEEPFLGPRQKRD